MYTNLYNYISSKVSIKEEEFALLKQYFTPSKLRKKQFLVRKGEICKYGAFIIKGALSLYHINEEGKKITLQFGIENWWISDRDSFNNLTPSNYYLQALEESDLLLFTSEDFKEMTEKFQPFRKMVHQLKEDNVTATQKRLTSTLTDRALTRYNSFCNDYPEIIKRFPQHAIASYLGIKPETLSRIRAKQALKRV